MLLFGGCDKKSSEAIVLEKEHIAAGEAKETPQPEDSPEPEAEKVDAEGAEPGMPLGPDEIVVDQYVMKAEVRGTSRDPRALPNEQWLVKVRAVSDGRRFTVHADRAQFERLKEGDRVQVSYRVGKYTNTVWSAEIH